jgi:hypothetical protein
MRLIIFNIFGCDLKFNMKISLFSLAGANGPTLNIMRDMCHLPLLCLPSAIFSFLSFINSL